MNFMLVSKENLGCAILLLLVVVLSLAKVFDVFIDTPLARILLLLLVLVISYLNQTLGVVSVLFIIIMLSDTNILYQEGFDTNTMLKNESDKKPSKDNEKKIEQVQKGDNSVDITTKIDDTIKSPTTSSVKIPENIDTDKTSDPSTITSSIATSTSTEGFDIIGLENDIKRGKQSNSIPVNSFMKESDFISPFDSSSFASNFMDFFN
jgi:hypothetical protein